MTEQNKAITRDFIDATLNRGDLASAGDYCWDDVVEQVPFPGQRPGLQGIVDVIASMRAAFPDLHWTIIEQIAEADKVMTRFEWTGTHKAEFLGVPASGRAVNVWGVVIDRLDSGKIRDTRIIMDTLGLMTQLGAIPVP